MNGISKTDMQTSSPNRLITGLSKKNLLIRVVTAKGKRRGTEKMNEVTDFPSKAQKIM